MKKIFFIGIFLFLISFNSCNAQIVISEIMYDPEGADTGREWIEILNDGNEAVDINGWKLYEAEINHKINLVNENGNFVIPAGGFVIFVDNPEKFKIDYPDFSGIIFDSAFSLSNSGEKIVIKNSELNEIDSVDYTPQDDSNNTGNSLQKIDGVWKSASPTIGYLNLDVGRPSPNTSQQSVQIQNDQDSSKITNKKEWPVEPQIFANAGNNRRAVVGADTFFEGKTLGLDKKPLSNARYVWNFGDGQTKEGQNISHIYNYPAKYVVILNVSSGEFSASDRIVIDVSPADLIISSVSYLVTPLLSNYAELYNRSKYELDISFWKLRVDGKIFPFPKDTIILSGSKLIFSSKTTSLEVTKNSKVELLYPNGEIAYTYDIQKSNTVFTTNDKLIESKDVTAVHRNISPEIDKNNIASSTLENNMIASIYPNIVDKSSINYFNKWTLGLLSFIFISVIAVLFVRKNKIEDEQVLISKTEKISDEIEIIN